MRWAPTPDGLTTSLPRLVPREVPLGRRQRPAPPPQLNQQGAPAWGVTASASPPRKLMSSAFASGRRIAHLPPPAYANAASATSPPAPRASPAG